MMRSEVWWSFQGNCNTPCDNGPFRTESQMHHLRNNSRRKLSWLRRKKGGKEEEKRSERMCTRVSLADGNSRMYDTYSVVMKTFLSGGRGDRVSRPQTSKFLSQHCMYMTIVQRRPHNRATHNRSNRIFVQNLLSPNCRNGL